MPSPGRRDMSQDSLSSAGHMAVSTCPPPEKEIMTAQPTTPPTVPSSLAPLQAALADPDPRLLGQGQRPQPGDSRSSVLILLSDEPDPTVLFTVRARNLRHHSGQISFPGGHAEAFDDDLIDTALRETREEVGLDRAEVHILGTLPQAEIPVSRSIVAPVVGWWRPNNDLVASPTEVADILRWPVSTLADPSHRVNAQLGPDAFIGPAWEFGELFLWGFTALLTDTMLRLGGWEQPWDHGRIVPVPPRFRSDLRSPDTD